MENKFELKDITTEKEENSRKYTLNFSNGKVQETITLSGQGKLKETVKI
ncbi:MAG: hypothetical protein K6A44_04915 [bacterium]|nr:hypothetical protein [bacterium]